jgi:hypothetical protein
MQADFGKLSIQIRCDKKLRKKEKEPTNSEILNGKAANSNNAQSTPTEAQTSSQLKAHCHIPSSPNKTVKILVRIPAKAISHDSRRMNDNIVQTRTSVSTVDTLAIAAMIAPIPSIQTV